MLDKTVKQGQTKKTWQEPEIKDFGKIEDVTQKSLGIFDGSGLERQAHHPSL